MEKKTRHKIALAALAIAATLPVGATHLTPIIQRNAPDGCPVTVNVMRQPEAFRTPAQAVSTASLTVSVTLDDARVQEVQNVLAVSADTGNPRMYELEKSGNVYKANVETGVYDIVAYIKSDNEDTQMFLFQEDEEITTTKRVLLSQRQATITTVIGRTSPAGSDLALPATGDPGNCSIADHLMMLRHNDFGTLLIDETAAFRKVCTHVSTNVIPKRFSLTRMDAFTWEQGPAFLVIPVDFAKDVNGPSDGGWQNVSTRIAGTPMSDAWKDSQDDPVFTMTGYFIASDRNCNAYVGIGNYNHEFLTDRIHYWAPEGYDNYYEYYPVLRDNVIVMADASVSSMPYRMTADGLMPTGLNLVGSGCMMTTSDGKIPAKGHPRFSDPLPDDAILGNAVPALVCLPSSTTNSGWNNGFLYNFTGRYGEELGLDAYNYSDALTASQLSQIGGYHRTLSVKRDGQEICSSPGDFVKWLDWGRGNSYSMELSMNNVLIDGAMEGVNTASLTYTSADGYIPTVTALWLRDNDKVSDRFDNSNNATLELTAATFSYVTNREFKFKAPSSVKAEYAPHGSSDFTELTLTEVPDNFFLPGYGTYFTAPLDVNRKSDDKWYDLRITVEGVDGAAQTQTLSPAFRMEYPGRQDSLEEVTATTAASDIYSIDGLCVAHGVSDIRALSLEPGIYIAVSGASTRKLLIK